MLQQAYAYALPIYCELCVLQRNAILSRHSFYADI